MCGICGYTGPEVPGLLDRMLGAIRHRGPDSGGTFTAHDLHLGIRRLRILDLDHGDQPIFNEDRSVSVVYNGEIYNFRELRAELEEVGHRFATRTDTEVLVHLYEEYGTRFASRLNGMFAFALYDQKRNRLVLARDQVGIKPLLYHWNGSRLVFASEAKAIILHPTVTPELDPNALHSLLNIRFVPGPSTLFHGIAQLPPGHLLTLENGRLDRFEYASWDFPGHDTITREEAAERFFEIISHAVERQMVADVPVGIFLSGGLDSSTVLAAASQSRPPASLNTYTLGFGEPTDELDDAKLVADYFGSQHHETRLSARPLELFPRIVHHTEQPKVNASQGYYLSRFARQEAIVTLSGLGGDELFYGYDIYRFLWPGKITLAGPLSSMLRTLRPAVDNLASAVHRLGLAAENPRRAVELLAAAQDPLRYYATLRNAWDLRQSAARTIYTDSWLRRVEQTTRDALQPFFDRPDLPFAEQVQWAEFRGKMVDDFLLNEDRTSMASSLEVRVPFLDRELIEFAFSLPFNIKHERQQLKPIMKRALHPLLPQAILTKRKWGFTFDSYEQFRKDLRGLCRRELSTEFLKEQGIFKPEFIGRVLDHPPSPRLRWHYFMIWLALGLKFWVEIFIEGRDWQAIEDRIAA